MWDLRPYKSGVVLHVRVTPRASRNGVEGCAEGVLRLKLRAIPAEGQANEACVKVLAELLGLPPSRLEIVRGARSREKWIWFKEVDPAVFVKRLESILSESV